MYLIYSVININNSISILFILFDDNFSYSICVEKFLEVFRHFHSQITVVLLFQIPVQISLQT